MSPLNNNVLQEPVTSTFLARGPKSPLEVSLFPGEAESSVMSISESNWLTMMCAFVN